MLTEQKLKKFESKTRVYEKFEFYGIHAITLLRHMFQIDQQPYASNIYILPENATFDDFCGARALFSWLREHTSGCSMFW